MPDEVSRDMSWSSLMIRRWEAEDIVGNGCAVVGPERVGSEETKWFRGSMYT